MTKTDEKMWKQSPVNWFLKSLQQTLSFWLLLMIKKD